MLRPIASLAAATLLLAACADAAPPAPSPASGRPHAAGAGDLLLRWGYEGGFTPPGYQLTSLPAFSLYGDGTIVRPGPQIEIYPPPALPALEAMQVDEAGIQAILDAAFDADLDTVTDLTDMGSVMVADAPDTVFTLRADGIDRTVRVYALGELTERPPNMGREEYEARRALQRLVERLGSLEAWLPDGSIGPSTPYDPTGSRVFVSRYQADPDLPQPAVRWPLPTPLAGIGDDAGAGFRCASIDGDAWSDALEPAAAGANQLTPWTSDGERHAVAFRPLLPDETSC
jgi:hypothetical protein